MVHEQVWIEISLLEHWGPKPHGIPRVTQNMFLHSLRRDDIRYFYYDRAKCEFVATQDVQYFCQLAAGTESYADYKLPTGALLSNEIHGGDRIVFSEVGWDHPSYLPNLLKLRREHPSSVFQYIICDLIPIKFPHFFEADFGRRARDFMRALPLFCDRYICISESTASDVRTILSKNADTQTFRLGSDIHDLANGPQLESAEDRPYVLSVGTIEIRKNHILLYFVWRRLAQLLGNQCPKLVLVGRPGWIAGDVDALLRSDPMVKDLVEIKHDVPNDRLMNLIQNSLFTVFPSFYEGWGLPASESLFYGKVCATSNTSSLTEINPFPELMFDPYDHHEAFEVIRSLIEDPARVKFYENQIPDKCRKQTWQTCFEELYSTILR